VTSNALPNGGSEALGRVLALFAAPKQDKRKCQNVSSSCGMSAWWVSVGFIAKLLLCGMQ